MQGRIHACLSRMGVRAEAARSLSLEAPPAVLPAGSTVAPIDIDIIVNERTTHTAFLIDDPVRPPVIYSPAEATSPSAALTVRDLVLGRAAASSPASAGGSRVIQTAPPQLQLDGGFDPGRWYRIAIPAGWPGRGRRRACGVS